MLLICHCESSVTGHLEPHPISRAFYDIAIDQVQPRAARLEQLNKALPDSYAGAWERIEFDAIPSSSVIVMWLRIMSRAVPNTNGREMM